MRYRQVHLDFHTSEHIKGIGKNFSKKQFQDMLIKGNVDSITVFSKCHHGWSYHPTTANKMHPELDFDLLAAQIEAAHEINVKTPVYLSAGYDEQTAVIHRDWLRMSKKEYEEGGIDFERPCYHKFCFNTPYLDKLLGEIKEVCHNYDADGIFLDIVSVTPCYCPSCLATMEKMGLDKDNEKDVLALAEQVYANYTKRVRETIDSEKPGLAVFHNGGHIRAGRRDLAFMDSHLELESLPTGGWGYDHFPMSAAYARTLGMEYLGMTGKFHKSWGEFGGFKHPNALKYEVALSAANGAKCSVGDQLSPDGFMDEATYTLIGEGYKLLKDREKWLENAKNVSDIAILSNEAVRNYLNISDSAERLSGCDTGCARILLEKHYLFDIIDTETPLENYKLVILADTITTDDYLKQKINNYIAGGGKVLASYKSGMNTDCDKFNVDFGVDFEGMSEYNPTYIRPSFDLDHLKSSAYVIYNDTTKVKNRCGEVKAIVENPFFNRTKEHFCSHRHAPTSGNHYSDALVFNGNTAYFSHKLFSEYYESGNIYTKEVVAYAIDRLLCENTSVKATLPAQGILTLMEKEDGSKLVHTLYASPVKRGGDIEIIEDIIPLYNTKVSVLCDKAPTAVTLVPENTPLEFEYKNGRAEFVIPKIDCWQMTEISF